jgi:hypothetical protein
MSVAKGKWIDMVAELIHNRGEGLREYLRGFQGGELPMFINSTHIPRFYYHYVLKYVF